jgi:myo-inositol 2-dehydrogenase / D-chiro-inositol 1-dehydrogenase
MRLGLIGFGYVVQNRHLGALAPLDGVAVTAVAEVDSARREQARRALPGARILASYPDLLALPELDAVIVALPSGLQAEAAMAAFEAGKNVYVEKPLATKLEEARGVIAAWRRAGTVGMNGLCYRVHPHYRRARELMRSGTIGELVGARSIFSAASTFPQAGWKRSRAEGGGVLLDLGSHHVDLVHFLFEQRVREVSAEVRSLRGEDDTATLAMRLAGGALVESFFSLAGVDEERFEVYGTGGKLIVDRNYALDVEVLGVSRENFRLRQAWRRLKSLRHLGFLATRARSPGHDPSYTLVLERFTEAVRQGRGLDPDLEDGYRSLEVIEAAESSARTGRRIAVPDPAADEPTARAAAFEAAPS